MKREGGADIETAVLVVVTLSVSVLIAGEARWRWDDDVNARAQRHATDLVGRAARVDTLAMSAPHPVLANYDSLVDAVESCRTDLKAFEAHHAAEGARDEEQAALAAFTTLLQKRTTQVERLKRKHAGQRNARRALVRWLAAQAPENDPQANELRRALAVFLLAPRNEHEVDLVAASKAVESRDAFARISRQIRVLMHTERELTTLIPDILREPLATTAIFVAAETAAATEDAERARDGIRKVGYAAVALVGLLGLWWPRRRRRT